jgi:predicted ATPase
VGPFVRRSGSSAWPDGTVVDGFAFRHPLYREALGAALPSRRRASLHLRIGALLERAYGERAPELAAELALHFEEGGDRARAARYRRLAAETAAGRYAFVEAETHLEKGLALLGEASPSPERDREEARLQSALGAVRTATRGYTAPEVEQAYTRALELSGGTSQESSAFPELWGLWGLHLSRAELDRALELAEQVRAIGEASGDRLMRLEAHHALWMTHFFRGEIEAALHHLDQGEPLYDPAADRTSALVYAHDAKAAALSDRSLLLWSFGRIDQALEMSRQAVEHARALGHPMSLAFILVNVAWLRLLRREPQACCEQAEAVIAHATEHDVPFWMTHAFLLRGWALAAQGDLARGIADIEQGLASMTAMGTTLGLSAHNAHLAGAKARAGHLAEARELIDRAKALVVASGERYLEAEILRLDAEVVLAEGDAHGTPSDARERAAALLRTACECANRQGARTLELRTMTMLARVAGRSAEGGDVRGRLAELLATFTEGFDTLDLQEARRLIEKQPL